MGSLEVAKHDVFGQSNESSATTSAKRRDGIEIVEGKKSNRIGEILCRLISFHILWKVPTYAVSFSIHF